MRPEPASPDSKSGTILTGQTPGGPSMRRSFTLEYWTDDDWYVGRLKEVPGVFSQGETLSELEENIRDAYQLLAETDSGPIRIDAQTKEIEVEV